MKTLKLGIHQADEQVGIICLKSILPDAVTIWIYNENEEENICVQKHDGEEEVEELVGDEAKDSTPWAREC